jgi:voltage-gated potassium channel
VRDQPADSTLEDVFYPERRVSFVRWEGLTGARPTVLFTGVLMVLTFVTGLSNLSQGQMTLDGPVAAQMPYAAGFVQFGGVLLAFLFGAIVLRLSRRKRLAWRVGLGLTPVVALLPLTTYAVEDVPLMAAAVLTAGALVRNRDQFEQPLGLSPLQVGSLAAIVGVLLYGSVGAYGLRGQGLAIETWSDAIYYVVVTISTVGYGDVAPTTAVARWFSLSVILFGTGAFTLAVGAVVVPAIESRMASAFQTMTGTDTTPLEDHIVVLGYNDLTRPLLDHIDGAAECVVVSEQSEPSVPADRSGISVMEGRPTEDATLARARIETAGGVAVCSNDDAHDIMAVLAVRAMAPAVHIVAVASEPRHVQRFEEVGVDEVIDVRAIGGRLLAESVLEPAVPAPPSATEGEEPES